MIMRSLEIDSLIQALKSQALKNRVLSLITPLAWLQGLSGKKLNYSSVRETRRRPDWLVVLLSIVLPSEWRISPFWLCDTLTAMDVKIMTSLFVSVKWGEEKEPFYFFLSELRSPLESMSRFQPAVRTTKFPEKQEVFSFWQISSLHRLCKGRLQRLQGEKSVDEDEMVDDVTRDLFHGDVSSVCCHTNNS